MVSVLVCATVYDGSDDDIYDGGLRNEWLLSEIRFMVPPR